MRSFKHWMCVLTLTLAGCTTISYPAKADPWGGGYRVYGSPWVQHAPPQYYGGGPQFGGPVYGTPHGVRRPGRFVCGADVFTGHYNCVRRKKAHFVRPMHYGHPGRHHGHRRHHGWGGGRW